MAGIFNKAYDQADRMLNTSGISSLPVVYKDVGGRVLSGIDKAEDIIFASNLPKDKKNELYNLLTGSKLRSWSTGRAVPNTSWNKATSDFLKDIVVTATAPPGTPLGRGASMIPGLQTTTDLTRRGIRGLLENKTIRNMLGNIDTQDYSKDIKEIQSKLKSNPDPDLAEELKILTKFQKSQELKRKNPLSAQYALYLDQFLPDKVVDGKRYYNPITDENKSKYFSEESQKGVGQELRQNLETKLKAREEGVSSGKTLKNIGDADLLYSEPDSLGKVYYGSYDSRGKWQEGIPNWDGTFTVKDEYNWNRDFPVGPGAIIRSLANYINPETRSLKSVAESIAGTVAPIGAQGEGRKIEFNVPAYSDPVKQLDVMRQLDRPPSVSPTGDLGRPPLDQPQQSDIVAEANKLGVPVIDVEQPGLPGMGWHHEAFNDPDDFTEQYTDYHTGLKHGGQTMSRGLSGINKTININGQPHSLAWINPGEASALKAMGGSGKKVDGIPAYYFDDPGYMMEEIESYYDPVDHGTDFTPAPLQYSDVQYLSSDGQTTTPDRFGASGLTSNIPIDLSQADLTNEEAQALGQMHQSQVKSEMDRLLEGVPLSQEGSGRSDFKGLAQLAAQEAIPGASDTWDFEAFAENYPWLMPGAAFVKGIGWIMGKDPNPVVSSYNMGGKIYNVYMDGTVKEQRKDEDYGDDGNEPVKKKFPLKKIAAAEKEEEKELTGIAKLLDEREDKPTKGEALQPQFDNIVAAGFSRQEAADMLNQPVNIFA